MTRAVRRAVSMGLVVLLVVGSLTILGPAPTARAAGQVSVYMSGLNFPIALAFSSDGRIFFAERFTGSIRIIQGGMLLASPFYTLPNTDTRGERGLLGLALDPGFPSTPWVYAYQTYMDTLNGTVYNRIVRILASGNTGTSLQVILAMPPLSGAFNHNGGVITFGPDGKLFAVVGENANPSLSQDLTSPMGKVLRMNSDGSAPTDNPYYGNPTANNLIYTYGHRNMFGLAFHPFTSRAYVTENGPACNDEINLLPNLTGLNRNFGWGPSATCATPPPAPMNTNRDGPNPILPIWWWAGTICPTNAAIYGGPYFPAWRGDMFMGDCNFGRLHRLHLVPPNYDSISSDSILWTAPSAVIEVEAGPDGAIWFTTPTTIYRYWDSAQPPVASFTANPNPTNPGVMVSFDASGSSDPDGTIVSYDWDFGDAASGTGVTTTHAYAAPGLYHVTLTVTDNETYTGNASQDVQVDSPQQPPVASFTANPNPTNPGVSVAFDASASFDPDGSIVSYTWDFGDSTTGSGVTASHAYAATGTYRVNLTVVDNASLSANTSQDIEVQPSPQPPIASFTANPNPTNPGVLVSFDASASYDPDGTVVSYAWDFGDLTTGAGVTTTHSFAAAGTYTVNLTVTDDENYTANASQEIDVEPLPPGPQPPVASFTRSPNPVNPGATVSFNASASSDSDGTIVSYSWEFGDSTTGSGVTATHAYANPGVYTANLTVVDNQSLSDTESHTINVNAPPTAAFTSSPTAVYIGIVVTFDAGSSSDPDGTIVSYSWNFGDSTTGTGQIVTHTYSQKGTFTVALVVTDDLGLTDGETSNLIVGNRPPQIVSSVPGLGPVSVQEGITQPFTVIATDPDGDVLTYTWRVDGVVVGGNTSGFNFSGATPGVHTVNVTVSDGSLTDSREWSVSVVQLIVDNVVPWNWIGAIIFAIAVFGVVLFLILQWRRRKREPDVPLPPPPPP